MMWTIEMSTLRNPVGIRLKKETDSHTLSSCFIDTSVSVAVDDPMEQPPEQTQAPPPSAASAPQPSDDDAVDPLPVNDDDAD
jgi:hypothetical protein